MHCMLPCSSIPLGEVTALAPNPLAGFKGPLQGGEKEGEGRKGGEKKEQEKDKGTRENTPE